MFKFKEKITDETGDDGIKNVDNMAPLKCIGNLWRTLGMSLINCEINFIITWSTHCFIVDDSVASPVPAFAINDTKVYVLLLTLSTEDNAKLLQKLKSDFKRTINWNKYQSKLIMHGPTQYLDYLIDPSFQVVNRFLV